MTVKLFDLLKTSDCIPTMKTVPQALCLCGVTLFLTTTFSSPAHADDAKVQVKVNVSTNAETKAEAEAKVEDDFQYGAVTWIQNSAEYRVLTKQTYRFALMQLQIGHGDLNWSADEVQLAVGDYQNKPPAVILDCDETVLDNSAFNARNIVNGKTYSTKSWNKWCEEEKALAIPGSLEFVNAAKGLGVRVFFITNRTDEVKQATINNLQTLGFPATEQNVLTKNSAQGRGGDKLSRRARIAQGHRIVLLIGDSMGDLCSGMDSSNSEERNQVADEKVQMLGSRWIMLPNPVYGSWQRALPEGKKALKLSQ